MQQLTFKTWGETRMMANLVCRVTPQEQGITEIMNSRSGVKGVLISIMPSL